MHIRELLFKLFRASLMGERHQLSPEERSLLEKELGYCIVGAPPEFKLYVERLGTFGGLNEWLRKNPDNWKPLPKEKEKIILEQGLSAIDNDTLTALAVRPTAIESLKETMDIIYHYQGSVREVVDDPLFPKGIQQTGRIMNLDADAVSRTWRDLLVEEMTASMELEQL